MEWTAVRWVIQVREPHPLMHHDSSNNMEFVVLARTHLQLHEVDLGTAVIRFRLLIRMPV